MIQSLLLEKLAAKDLIAFSDDLSFVWKAKYV